MDFPAMYPKYKEKPVIPSKKVAPELEKEYLDLDDVVEILNEGFDCPRTKRKKSIEEKCIHRGNKITKVVIQDLEDYWLLRHVGSFIISKKKRRRFK